MQFHLWAALTASLLVSVSSHAGDAGLQVDHAWTRATPTGTDAAAVYLRITNGPTNPEDKLVGAATDVAARAQLHSQQEDNGLKRMRPVAAIPIPPGQVVEARSGGMHVMLKSLARPLVAGQTFMLTLHFERAGDIPVPVKVEPLEIQPADEHQHHHH